MRLKTSSSQETGQGVGASVQVHAAVIPDLKAGKAVLHNVAAIVVDDSALSVLKPDYQIEGCLGFPVLAALGAVTFYGDGRVRFSNVQRQEVHSFHNFFLETFAPLVAADLGIGTRVFTLDTGAQGTSVGAVLPGGC